MPIEWRSKGPGLCPFKYTSSRCCLWLDDCELKRRADGSTGTGNSPLIPLCMLNNLEYSTYTTTTDTGKKIEYLVVGGNRRNKSKSIHLAIERQPTT